MTQIKKKSKNQLKRQVSRFLDQISLRSGKNNLISIRSLVNAQTQKDLKGFTREKSKILLEIIQKQLLGSIKNYDAMSQGIPQKFLQNDQELKKPYLINLNHPIKIKNQEIDQDITRFDSKSVFCLLNSYFIRQANFANFGVNYKDLAAKMMLTYSKKN